jgi:hypothetical protein
MKIGLLPAMVLSLPRQTQIWVGGAAVGLMVGALLGASPASAQASSDNGCYIVTSSGRRLPLDKLCGTSQPKAPLAPKPSTNGRPKLEAKPAAKSVFRAKIKRRLNRIPVVDVTFNGSQTFEMIFDTGASGTLITQRMARALRMRPVSVTYSTIADGSTVAFPVGRLGSMTVGGATVTDLPVAIAANMDVGLLGQDFFGNYDVQIKQNEIEFHPRDSK